MFSVWKKKSSECKADANGLCIFICFLVTIVFLPQNKRQLLFYCPKLFPLYCVIEKVFVQLLMNQLARPDIQLELVHGASDNSATFRESYRVIFNIQKFTMSFESK